MTSPTPGKLPFDLRRMGDPLIVVGLGALFGYLCVTAATLYTAGAATDFSRLGSIRQIDPVLAQRPALWVGALAGAAFAGAALLAARRRPLSERWRFARRVLLALSSAGFAAVVLAFLSPHLRIAIALFLAASGALATAGLAAFAERGASRWIDRALVWGLFLALTGVFFLYSHVRHASFGAGSWDLGCYNHSVWLASRFKPLMSTVLGDVHVLGDHWCPIVYVLGPVFWVTDHTSALLFVQAALVASTAFPLFWLARRADLGRLFSVLLALSFLLSYSVQSSIEFDFHETTISLCFFAYAFYFIETGRIRHAIPFLVLLFLCKEGMPLYVAFLGLYAALFHRKRAFGYGLFAFGLVSFFVIVKWVMPGILAATQSKLDPQKIMEFRDFGTQFDVAFANMLRDPVRTLATAFTPAEKLRSLLVTFGAFGFLAFFAPRFLVLAIPLVAERFLTSKATLWGMWFHYGGPLTLVAALGAISGAARIREPLGRAWERLAGWRPSPLSVAGFLGVGCLAASLLLNRWGIPGQPSAFHQLYRPHFSRHVAANRRAVAVVPPEASVAAQNHFVPHLALREKIWLLHRPIRAEYVVANPDDGPWPFDRRYVVDLLRELLGQGYRPVFSEATAIVLRRGAPEEVPLSPAIRAALGM